MGVGATVVGLILAAVVGVVVGVLIVRNAERRERDQLREEVATAREALHVQERSVAEDREVRSLVLASMEEGVLLLDRDGERVFANEALARHLGSIPADADHLLPLDLKEAVKRAAADGIAVEADAETGAPSRWLRATVRPVGDDGSVLLVVTDVTEARRIDAIRRDFVTNASHELKTPVASIRAAAETLRDGAIDDPVAADRFTEQLEREAMRLARIVSDLLDLSRLETGSEIGEIVRLDRVAGDEIQRLEDDAHAAGVNLTLVTDGAPSVRGSARDLSLLIRNLVDNAVRYTPTGGSVDVRVSEDLDTVIVLVSDTGVGIPGRDLPRVFERFYRVDRARSRETGGTGLGLSIVRHVAENHGGSVTVRSELGAGSTFEVRLPRPAHVEGPTGTPPIVVFLCIQNAGRSQMAAGWMRHLAGDRVEVSSGGSDPASSVNPVAVEAMAEVGIDISEASPQRWTDDVLRAADVIVTMGCGDACPVVPGKRYLDWDVGDPAGLPLEGVRPIRDEIGERVRALLREIGRPGPA